MKKKIMDRLDEINVLRLLEIMSVGNLVRGVMFVTSLVEPVKKSIVNCTTSTMNKIKTVIESEKQTASEPETQKSR